jgi:release factor glutamine methyltransferase
LEHEPHLALFVKNEDPLLFYDKIADLAKIFLTLKGTLYFEINQYLGDAMKALLKSKGFKDLELRKDIFGVNRMIKTCQSTIDQM